MAIAGIYSVLRDALGVVPSMLCTLNIPGVTFGIYNSPMLLSVGFLVGFAPVAFWFAGALLGNFGIIVGGTAAGLFDVVTAQGIVKSLGMGLMMGFGVAVVLRTSCRRSLASSAVLPPTAPPTPTSNRLSRAPLSSTPASSAWALPPSP